MREERIDDFLIYGMVVGITQIHITYDIYT
jgi:hypothetical protein